MAYCNAVHSSPRPKMVQATQNAMSSAMEDRLKIDNAPLRGALLPFLTGCTTAAERINAVQANLESEAGKSWRQELGKWTVRMVPVELLVPDVHKDWRPIVREAVLFVVSRLSPSRLAPKIVEQMALPPQHLGGGAPSKFIAKVPGLQKIGQVLARNRHLHPRLRRALIKLENGISDVTIEEIRDIINGELRLQIETYAIKIQRSILSEASVSAVVRLAWQNPASGRRQHGVFKVLKPHIANCYAEDLRIIGQLAQHLARQHRTSGAPLGVRRDPYGDPVSVATRSRLSSDATLADELSEYRSLRGIRYRT